MNTTKPKYIHEIVNDDEGFLHRIKDADTLEYGRFVSYDGIAMLGNVRAVMPDYWGAEYPEVFEMIPVEFEGKIIDREE